MRPSTYPYLTKTTILPVGWDIAALQPEPNIALYETSVDFVAPNATTAPFDAHLGPKQVEAHLFMVDLARRNDELRAVWAGSYATNWDAIAGEGPSGRDVYLPYPPANDWPTPARLAYAPNLADFWPTSVPAKPASAPKGAGSVKTAWVVYPGACSSEVSLTAILDAISDQMFDRFAGVAAKGFGLGQRNYARGTAMLESAPWPAGGFGLFFDYAGTDSGVYNFEAAANVEYSFGTREGILSLENPSIHDWMFYPLIHPFCPSNSSKGLQCGQEFVDALQNQIPDRFLDETTRRQRVPSPLLFIPCELGFDSTVKARTAAASEAKQGAMKLGMSQAAAAAVHATMMKASNWVCVDAQNNVLPPFGYGLGPGWPRLILRATRIQVYPDAVELVWFDDYDPYATGFALYAMLAQLGTTNPYFYDAMNTLCDRQRRFVPFGSRPIATVTRGPASCAAPPCPR